MSRLPETRNPTSRSWVSCTTRYLSNLLALLSMTRHSTSIQSGGDLAVSRSRRANRLAILPTVHVPTTKSAINAAGKINLAGLVTVTARQDATSTKINT